MKFHGPISHRSHPQHKLKWEHTKNPFLCNGCKEGGIGNKYTCSECDFDLHEKCASPYHTMEHAFYKKCEFLFHDKIPFNMKCDACNKLVQGFGFQCRSCDYVLHPCCANLPWLLHDGSLDFHLRWKKLSRPCDKCQKKGPGWSYRSDCKKYNLHVACAKELLMEAWDATYRNEDENKVREIQTRIPKMVVAVKNHHHDKGKGGGGGGKILKWARTVAVAVRVVVSALLGDPTAIIAAVASSIFPSPAKEKLGT